MTIAGGGTLHAQDADSVIDAAAQEGITYSTGTSHLDEIVDMGTQVRGADGVNRWRGLTALTMWEFTDPRLDGVATLTWNIDQYGDGVFDGPEWGTAEIENDGGAWRGTYTGFTYLDDEVEWFVVYLTTCAGEGGYEGLVANCHQSVPGGGWDAQHKGVVMPCALAEMRGTTAE